MEQCSIPLVHQHAQREPNIHDHPTVAESEHAARGNMVTILSLKMCALLRATQEACTHPSHPCHWFLFFSCCCCCYCFSVTFIDHDSQASPINPHVIVWGRLADYIILTLGCQAKLRGIGGCEGVRVSHLCHGAGLHRRNKIRESSGNQGMTVSTEHPCAGAPTTCRDVLPKILSSWEAATWKECDKPVKEINLL